MLSFEISENLCRIVFPVLLCFLASVQLSLAGEIKISVICEGKRGWLQCKQYELIKIKTTFWGRDDEVTCPAVHRGLAIDKLCVANEDNTRKKVDVHCKNEQACEVIASNIFFDDNSCGNTYKYLKIWYECIPDKENFVDALQLREEGKARKRKRAAKEKRHVLMFREQQHERQKRHV